MPAPTTTYEACLGMDIYCLLTNGVAYQSTDFSPWSQSDASQTRQLDRSRIRLTARSYVRRLKHERSGPKTSTPGLLSALTSKSASIGCGLQTRRRSTFT